MEQLKIGDKVEILWEKTNYYGNYYNRNGVIVGEELKLDVSSGKVNKLYSVGDILPDDEKYTLYFKKEELVKIPEITKKFEKFESVIIDEDVMKRAIESVLGRTILKDTLPTKVVFDKNKRKTTLLFGDKPYKRKVSGIAHESDTFDTASGFFIQLAKNILKDKWKDKFKLWEYLSNNDFEMVKIFIFAFVLTHLKEELGMSFRQLDKLTHWDFKKPITFEINGIKHTIEVEHRLDPIEKEERLKIIKEQLVKLKQILVSKIEEEGETTKIEEEGEIK